MIPGFVPGWLGIDDNQRAMAATLPRLAEAAPHLMAYSAAADDRPILLYSAWRTVLGKDPDYPAQQIGDCVSFGHAHGNDLLQCIQIAQGDPAEFQETDTEAIYGMSREVGGMLGNSDGSYGAAAVKAMTTIGMVSRAMLGSDGAYSGQRAKTWGRTGCPKQVKDAASPFKLGAGAKADTYDEIVAALRAGCPVSECSNFLPGQQRDKDGFCRPSGSGGHCQLIVGVRFDRPGLCIANSWGPDYFSGPQGLDCPAFAYWIDRATAEKWICGSGDNFALSKTTEFVIRRWDWSRVA